VKKRIRETAALAVALPLLSAAVPVSCLAETPASESSEANRPTRAEDLPTTLYRSGASHSYPSWVSAELAIDPDGEINANPIHPQAVSTIISLVKEPVVDGCVELGNVYESWVDPPNRGDLQNGVAASELVLLGTVVGAAPGFQHSTPGQLLAIEPSRFFRAEHELDRYFTFFPVARFRAGPYEFCKTDTRVPIEPSVGDEVLLMVFTVNDPRAPYVDSRDEFSFVILPSAGGLSFAKVHLANGDNLPRSREALVEQVDHYASEARTDR